MKDKKTEKKYLNVFNTGLILEVTEIESTLKDIYKKKVNKKTRFMLKTFFRMLK